MINQLKLIVEKYIASELHSKQILKAWLKQSSTPNITNASVSNVWLNS